MKQNQLLLPFEETIVSFKAPKPKQNKIKASELKSHGITTPATISAEVILELGRRYEQEPNIQFGRIQSPDDIYHIFKTEMKDIPATNYNLVAVNVKNMITVTKLFHSFPQTKQSLRWAVSNSVAALIICRNSEGTLEITNSERKLIKNFDHDSHIVGIELLDFVVIGEQNFASARVEGIL